MGKKAKITQTTTSRKKKSDNKKRHKVKINKVTGKQKVPKKK